MSEKSMFERMSAGEWYGEKPDAELSEHSGAQKTWRGNLIRCVQVIWITGQRFLQDFLVILANIQPFWPLFMWIMAVISRLGTDAL